jgi:succinate dehydrogenase iron-sulfur subunit
MASAPKHMESEDEAARTAAVAEKRPVVPSRARIVPEGRLPVSEFAFDRMGAASPFGDDISFPLPVNRLTYTHPSENTAPQHH